MGDISVTFRHLEATNSLREYVIEKLSRAKKHFGDQNEINVVLSSEKHRYTAEIILKAGKITANAREETDDMYSAIDLAVDKVDRQMKKHKEKLKSHKVNVKPQKATSRYDTLPSESAGESQQPKIIKTENVFAKPMSLEEAVDQLSLLNSDFLVFINDSNRKVNVIYYRKDGDYGLIEPEI
ncbi:MAG: ribosome-associated translation inhibitor RaiA [Deltaproteobacteria bacterium]|nr:ribosome-associated translation inhibitor RaiA [Deltaproteobacteria bacterium]